jgi:hypothetical protein
MNPLISASQRILNQISDLVSQFTQTEYSQPVTLLSGSSIGMHLRHTIEFYTCLFQGLSFGKVNYDCRQRDKLLETNPQYANVLISSHIALLGTECTTDSELDLEVLLSENGECTSIPTTFFRELAYNLEHSIHHLAIIKIALVNDFKHIQIPENFGVAYSTIKHQQVTT